MPEAVQHHHGTYAGRSPEISGMERRPILQMGWADWNKINTYTAVNALLPSKCVEQQTYRSCMGLLKPAEKYSDALLEAACKKALSYTSSPSYKRIKS
jgi:hypothetical protein